ncbi:MAG: UDP-N-acetylmuramoyl-tripeptide--D-alanyl-D-alanine ligase [Treponema sp.]
MNEVRKGRETQEPLMNVGELVKSTLGILLFGSENESFSNLSIDSRNVEDSSFFIPLRGKNLDGHSFIEDAIKKGSNIVLVDSLYEKEGKTKLHELYKTYGTSFILVENTLQALQNASRFYLNKMNLKLKIGITGSSGKTTVKEMIGSLFSQSYNTFISQGNLNSETGLPLSIFMLRKHHEVGVFEMGMNRKGEIRELSNVLSPDVAIITNIGTAHIGMLGSKEAIALEKKEIFSNFKDSSVGFIPNCSFTNLLKDIKNGKIVIYGSSYLNGMTGVELKGLFGSIIHYEDVDIHVKLPGSHNVENAILTITVGKYFNFEAEKIKNALENMGAVFGRSEVKEGFVTCFFDCYNANPESMKEAINFCDALVWKAKKIAILGSMLELGDMSLIEHENICEKALNSSFDVLYFFGNEISLGLKSYLEKKQIKDFEKVFGKKVFLYKDEEIKKLKGDVASSIEKYDFVLLKASRGLALERLEDVLFKVA